MGQIPPKYMYPSAPYGGSQATNTLNAAQPIPANPQTPLLPPNFTDSGATMQGNQQAPQNAQKPGTPSKLDPMKLLFGI